MANFYFASLHATDLMSQVWFQPGDLARWNYVKKHRRVHVSLSMWTMETDGGGGTWMTLNRATLSRGRQWEARHSPSIALFMWTVWRRWFQDVILRSTLHSLYLISFTWVGNLYFCHLWTSQSSVCFTSQTHQMCDFSQILVPILIFGINVQCVGFRCL